MPANVVAIVLGLPFNVACAYYSGQVAGRRGRSVRTWIWMGAIFGPFAFPVLYLLPQVRSEKPRLEADGAIG